MTAAAAAGKKPTSCWGKKIDTLRVPWQTNLPKVGEMRIYWNEASGENCAMVHHTGKTVGVALDTRVSIESCIQSELSSPSTNPLWQGPKTDNGIYKYFAGPVWTTPGHHCIVVIGNIATRDKDGAYFAQAYPNPTVPSKNNPYRMGYCH